MNKRTIIILGVPVGALVAWQQLGLALLLVLVAVTAAVGAVWWIRRTQSQATVNRWGNRARRTSGVATNVEVLRRGSALAMHRKATIVRPSLADLTPRQRLMLPVTEFAVPLCRCGVLNVYASTEDVTLAFGGPRMGKSGWLAGRILDAAGACLVTSTRTDLHEITKALREKNRGPVYVFNPAQLGDVKSTISFPPLTDCKDPQAAIERAIDMIPSKDDTGGDRDFWDHQARRVFGALMHAAALGDLSSKDVLAWIADPEGSKRQVLSLLRRSIEPAFVKVVEQYAGMADRTRASVTTTIMPALTWVTSSGAFEAAEGRAPAFDVRQLLEERATVHLMGAEEAHTAPLLAALTGFIAREARRLAATRPGGRLDPHLTLALDEAALVCPIPLPSWTADMGGRGVTILACFQSRAQLIQRYGDAGAAVVLNNAGAVMVFGGTKDRADLEYWSTLAGERDEVVVTRDGSGKVTSKSVRKVPVLTPAQFAKLPEAQAVVFRRGMSPAVGQVEMAWRRKDVRAHKRATNRANPRPPRPPQWSPARPGSPAPRPPAGVASGWAVSPAGVASPALARSVVTHGGR